MRILVWDLKNVVAGSSILKSTVIKKKKIGQQFYICIRQTSENSSKALLKHAYIYYNEIISCQITGD